MLALFQRYMYVELSRRPASIEGVCRENWFDRKEAEQPEAQSEPSWPEIAQLLIIHEVLPPTRALCIGPVVEGAALFSDKSPSRQLVIKSSKGSGALLQLRQGPQTGILSLTQHRLQKRARPHCPS